jgi:putative hydrolase of the HAD superfamily
VSVQLDEIDAVTFDFYNTLVYHHQGHGRGSTLMEYLRAQGLPSDPWEHQVLYDVFEQHGTEYAPHQSEQDKRRYLVRFTNRVFLRLNVRAPDRAVADHAANVWRVLGPASLAVFPEVSGVLEALRGAGYRLAVVSNWQGGLRHFCTELGLGDAFDPCRRLGVPSHRVLHVGDSVVDDVEGALGAGLRAVLVQREPEGPPVDAPMIPNLDGLPQLLGLPGEAGGGTRDT